MQFTVCGAGPVGSYLAWKLSEAGYRTLLLEEHEKIGLPLSCSGLVSRNIWNFVPENKRLVEREIKGARIHLENKIHTFRSKQALVLNRTMLDAFLAEKASRAGTEVMTGTRLFSFTERPDGVSLYVKKSGFRNMKTKVLAGCDGPLSLVRKKMGIKQPKFLHGIFCYADEEPDSYVDLYYKKTPGFFGWRIPRGDMVEYGMACKNNAKRQFDKFSRKLRIPYKRVYSGLIPYGLLPRVSSTRVFLCGDAASHTKPFSGGGVVYGLTSANVAASVIKPEEPDMSLYEKEWRSRLAGEIRAGMLLKKSYYLPSPLLNFLLSSLSKKRGLEMDRPSSVF